MATNRSLALRLGLALVAGARARELHVAARLGSPPSTRPTRSSWRRSTSTRAGCSPRSTPRRSSTPASRSAASSTSARANSSGRRCGRAWSIVVPEYLGTRRRSPPTRRPSSSISAARRLLAAPARALAPWHLTALHPPPPSGPERLRGHARDRAPLRPPHAERPRSGRAAARAWAARPSARNARSACSACGASTASHFRGFRPSTTRRSVRPRSREGVIDVAVTFRTDGRLATGALVPAARRQAACSRPRRSCPSSPTAPLRGTAPG